MADAPESGPSPRAFCHATGLVFQIVGFVFALGGCCWWSLVGKIESPVAFVGRQPTSAGVLAPASPAQTWAMLAVCLTFLGGLVLIPLGMGLQHDRSQRGFAPKVVTGLVAAFFGCYSVGAIWKHWSFGAAIFAVVLAAVWTVLFLLAGASAETLKRFPPPMTSPSQWTQRDEDDLRKSSSPR